MAIPSTFPHNKSLYNLGKSALFIWIMFDAFASIILFAAFLLCIFKCRRHYWNQLAIAWQGLNVIDFFFPHSLQLFQYCLLCVSKSFFFSLLCSHNMCSFLRFGVFFLYSLLSLPSAVRWCQVTSTFRLSVPF